MFLQVFLLRNTDQFHGVGWFWGPMDERGMCGALQGRRKEHPILQRLQALGTPQALELAEPFGDRGASRLKARRSPITPSAGGQSDLRPELPWL